MAEPKKSVTAGKTVEAEPEKTAVRVKEEASVKKDVPETKETVKTEGKAVKKETKTTAKKAPAKKETEKKTTVKKTAVEKVEKAEPKTRGRKAAESVAKQIIHFQFSGKSYSTEDLEKIAADVWKYDLHKEEAYKSLELYVKPEESVVYYVFNGDITGSFFI